MKSIKVLCIVIFVFLVTYLPASYAGENFVTTEHLAVEDVDAFIAALAREEAGIGRGSYVTINNIEQKDNHATVECEFCYVESTFTNVKHAPKKIVFERTESGKWIHVATGMYLTK
jgi:hypothetical protein